MSFDCRTLAMNRCLFCRPTEILLVEDNLDDARSHHRIVA